MTSPVYRIRDWSKHFENNRTRELKELRFVILPNKHDGDGYTELLDHANGAAHYGAWCSIVQVASKCDPRGTLLRDSARPHDSGSLSRLTRIPKAVFDEALPRLVTVGWLAVEHVEADEQPQHNQQDGAIPQEGATSSAAQSRTPVPESAPELNRTEENRTGEEKKSKRADRPRDPRANHPAIVAVREVKGKYPDKDLWDSIIETVGEHPDLPLMRKCWVTWRTRGYLPNNYGWLVDWYVNGIQGASNGTSKGRSESGSERSSRNLRENIEYIRSLSPSDCEDDREDPAGLLTTSVRDSRVSGSR